jgi:CHAP domain/Putative peptidoglycan binding domain
MNFPNRVIKEGEKNKTIVRAIQQRLNELGCGPCLGTGVFGPATKSAVKLFQSTHRDQEGNPLEIDGKVGSITWEALFGADSVDSITEAPNEFLSGAVNVALSQVGTMEVPPGSNSGQQVNAYLASVGLPPGLFWCAAFVYWCFKTTAANSGRKNPLVKTGGCLDHWNRTKGKRVAGKDAVNKPSLLNPGNIFIIDHGRGAGHTGIIEAVEGGFIHTIEGNSNPSGSANGIGVFQLQRKIVKINKGFIVYR